MKKHLLSLLTLILITATSCQKKIDIEKEKEAIKAVFEQEKDAFFKQDYASMSNYWVNEPSSIKMFISSKGQTKYEGGDNIIASEKKETGDNSWDRKLVTATFTNYQIDVMNNSAWVLCETHWKGIIRTDTITDYAQTRISVLKKVDGNWKFSLMAIYGPAEK
jgi:hypothetical protein